MYAAGSMAASHSAEHTGNKGECVCVGVFLKIALAYFVFFLYVEILSLTTQSVCV